MTIRSNSLILVAALVGYFGCNRKPSLYVAYHKNGKTKLRMHLTEGGVANGAFETYYETGELRTRGEWHNGIGNGYEEVYYRDGDRQLASWIDGKLSGEVTQYYPNGNLKLRARYDKGYKTGKYEIFRPDGNVDEFHFYAPRSKLVYLLTFTIDGQKEQQIYFPTVIHHVSDSVCQITFELSLPIQGELIVSLGKKDENGFQALSKYDTLDSKIKSSSEFRTRVDCNELFYQARYVPASNDSIKEIVFDTRVKHSEVIPESYHDSYYDNVVQPSI